MIQKFKAVIDRFEGEKAVLRNNGNEIIIPKKLLGGFSEGETVHLLLASDEEDTKNNEKLAKELLIQVFKKE